MSRLKSIKRQCHVLAGPPHEHVKIAILSRGRWVVQLTSITADLTRDEVNCLYFWAYALATMRTRDNQELKTRLFHANYAEVFGSLWELKYE